jgi:energy-coupling factor transport system ATP-binding protein
LDHAAPARHAGHRPRGERVVIVFDRVRVTYAGAATPVLDGVDLTIGEGELCLVVGPSGSGKSTLLRAINGLVPRFSGGTLEGRVLVDGRSTADEPPRQLADLVGYVGQDPLAGFVTDTVEDELAYVMENLGVEPQVMRRRVEDVLDLLSLHDVRRRALSTLSGGQQQRVAIGSVLTASPRVLVLDEPTSALDPSAAEDVLAALARLVHDIGVTVVMAEHRLERVVQFADRVLLVPGDGRPVVYGDPAEVLRTAPVAPPVVELGRLEGWDPLPLSVRDARRLALPLRQRLESTSTTWSPSRSDATQSRSDATQSRSDATQSRSAAGGRADRIVAQTCDLVAGYDNRAVIGGIDLTLYRGEVVAVMGRNGAGKSTLLAQLAGLRAPLRGAVRVGGKDPHRLDPVEARHRVGFVPQDPSLLLYHQRVDAECAAADQEAGAAAGASRRLLERIVGPVDPSQHPRDLSEGQRLALALAVVLVASPDLVLLDEPTRGLDYSAKATLGAVLGSLAAEGRAVVLASHDVEVVAAVADRAIVLADGDVVADGPARQVVTHSPVFAPQVAKVLAPDPWLTVDEVVAALAAVPDDAAAPGDAPAIAGGEAPAPEGAR